MGQCHSQSGVLTEPLNPRALGRGQVKQKLNFGPVTYSRSKILIDYFVTHSYVVYIS